MEDELVLQETAKLAKEKGFDEYYISERPTQSLLQRWLREVHKIHLTVIHRAYSGLDKIDKYDYLLEGTAVVYRHFDTYEQALEDGLKDTLTLVNNNEKI